MFKLASFPEIQGTKNGAEFAEKVHARTYSPEFMRGYDAYMEKFGSRGIKEIDVGTPRAYENLPAFFQQLQALDTNRDVLTSVAKRRADAYDKLLAITTKKGKAKQFVNQAAQDRNLGYREAPKFLYVIIVDLLRQRALALGAEFVTQGRLDQATQIFDLHIDEVAQAQQDPALPLRPLIEKNLAPRRAFAHVREWPRIIDSRGKIFRAPPMPAKEGELAGDPIALGVVRGRASVLHSAYEKPLLKGEILVTHASDPGWTPLFLNAGGVVLEAA